MITRQQQAIKAKLLYQLDTDNPSSDNEEPMAEEDELVEEQVIQEEDNESEDKVTGMNSTLCL